MLETLNDWLLFAVSFILVIFSFKLLVAVNFPDKHFKAVKVSVFEDYENNERE